jgi:undecaprenyl phosphate-alpha-L-ara4FN deformylase
VTPLRLRVDVCTRRALRDGVPGALAALKAAGARATFMVTFGPDASGLALLKMLKPSFARKVLRSGGGATYGWASAFYGTLLPAPLVGAGQPDVVRRIRDEGHEVALHGWDHRRWQDRLPRYPRARLRDEFRQMRDAAETILGRPPAGFGAPAWLVSPDLLELEEEAGFQWAGDTRGYAPYLPVLDGRPFRVPQLPVTLPTLDEALALGRGDGFVDEILRRSRSQPDYCCLAAHAEFEGLAFRSSFEKLLRDLDRPISTLGAIPLRELPRRSIIAGRIEGRSYDMSLEGPGP